MKWILTNEDGSFVETLVEIAILGLGSIGIATRIWSGINGKANDIQKTIQTLSSPDGIMATSTPAK